MAGQDLFARLLEPENLRRALHQVRRTKGAPGIGGMRVDQRGPQRTTHWPTIRASWVAETYTPQPVRRVAISKPGGGIRPRGVPVVLARFLEQAVLQVLEADWDPPFSEGSYGFRPKCSAHQAGERGMASVTRFLARRLKLVVPPAKSTVARPWHRKALGFTFTRTRPTCRKVSAKALQAFTAKVRTVTGRTRGRTLHQIVGELRTLILGWRAYFGFAEVPSPLRDLDKWFRRRLRGYHWKQWGRCGYRELRKRGVSRALAWNTAKSAHGPCSPEGRQTCYSIRIPERRRRTVPDPCCASSH